MNNENLHKSIFTIFEASKGQEPSLQLYSELDEPLNFMANYLSLEKDESFFLTIILGLNFQSKNVDNRTLCKHFDISAFDLLPYIQIIEQLSKKGYLKNKVNHFNEDDLPFDKTFNVSKRIATAVMKKQECPVIVVRTIENTLDALENINSLIDNLEKKELTVAEFHMETAIIFETNKNFELFKQFNSKKLNPMEQIITCFVIWKAFTGSFSVSINAIISSLCIKKIQEVTLLQGISNRVNPIIEHGFLENKEGFFLNNVELGISQYTVEILKAFVIL